MLELIMFLRRYVCRLLGLLFLSAVSTSPIVSAECVPPAPDMVGWWRGEGNAEDPVGFNYGNPVGNVSYAHGQVGLTFNFDGDGDAIQLGNPPSLHLQDFTIEAWVKRHSVTASSLVTPDAELFCHGEGGYGFGMWPDGRLFLTKVGSDNITASIGVSDTNFHHVAVTKSGTQVTFYVDGVPDSKPGYASVFDFVSGVAIGARGDDLNNSFYGLIDDLSVYARALSGTEIQSIFAAGSAGKCRAVLPPLIVTQPESRTAYVGGSLTFSALVAGDSLTYQWLFNGTNLAGATSSALVLTNISLNDAGSYTLLASNSASTATSADALLTVNVPPPCTVAATGLVSWWKAEGNFVDWLGPNDGTNSGNLSFAEGEVGAAFNFDGVNDLVGVPPSASLDVGMGGGLTIECWVNPFEISSARPLVEWNRRTGANPYGPSLWISFGGGEGSLYANIVDTSGSYHDLWSTGGEVRPGAFQHVGLTYDKASGVATLYHNGTAIASQSLGTFQPRTSFPLYVGHRPSDGGRYFKGQLDEVSVYSRALSAGEIQAIYAASVSGKCVPEVPPAIYAHPTNQTVRVGTNVTLSASALGTRPFFHQWLKDGSAVPGATNATLVLSNVQPSNAGAYALRACHAL